MFYPVDDAVRRQAKTPHELAMLNLILCNLLIGVALLAGAMAPPDSLVARAKWLLIALPLALSLLIMALTWWRATHGGGAPWFVTAHWRLAARRYRLLLLVYPLCAAIIGIGHLHWGDGARTDAQFRRLPPALQEMERRKLASQDLGGAIWARLGVVPLLLATMVSIMLESGALYQAGRGEVPDPAVARCPPPAGLEGRDQPS